jgi:FKBP-type peptidyl-prolyl cis-trans isomerase
MRASTKVVVTRERLVAQYLKPCAASCASRQSWAATEPHGPALDSRHVVLSGRRGDDGSSRTRGRFGRGRVSRVWTSERNSLSIAATRPRGICVATLCIVRRVSGLPYRSISSRWRCAAGGTAALLLAIAIPACGKKKSGGVEASSAVSAPLPAAAASVPPPFAPDDVPKSISGLASKVLLPGTGDSHPAATDVVKVTFTGWSGASSSPFYDCKPGESFSFPLRTAIPAWFEAIPLMVPGETRRFWVPAQLTGIGSEVPRGTTELPPGDLVFDIKLLEIVPAPKPPPPPSDVAGPPASAKRTRSGVAYRLLSSTNDRRATRVDPHGAATISYTAWTSKGELYDTSVPLVRTLRLSDVTPALAEGMQRMRTGDKMRFWIPAAPAKGARGSDGSPPHGPLVYDIEIFGVLR